MQEEKKEKKTRLVLKDLFPTTLLALSQATEAQKALMASHPLLEALRQHPSVLQELRQSWLSLRHVGVVSKLITGQSELLRLSHSPIALGITSTYLQDIRKLSDHLTGIREIVKSATKAIDITPHLPKIEAIRPQTDAVVNGLLRHIDFLEKELAKEREKNKALLKRLSDLKKELKKKYVV